MVQLAIAKLEAAIEAFDHGDNFADLAVRDAAELLNFPALRHLIEPKPVWTREGAVELIARLEAAER